MTLHDAILAVIKKNGFPMKAAEISQQINRFSLYKPKSNALVTPNQVWARVNKYKELFRITDDNKITELSEKFLQKEDFLKWVRNFLVHNYSVNSDILIPFIIYYIRVSERSHRYPNRSDFYGLLNEYQPSLKNHLLEEIEKLYISHLPPKFYKTVIASFEQLDEIVLRNILILVERFASLISEMNDEDFAQLFGKLISQVSGAKSRGFEFATPDVVAKFVSHLIDLKTKQSIYDPYAGLCILLSKVVANKKGIAISANDINDKTGTVGILNLIVNGVDNFEYTFNEALHNDQNRYDWVISNPPFHRSISAKRNSVVPEDPFENPVSYIYRVLKSHGKAIIVVPDSFLFLDDKVIRRTRGELVIAKAIKAVISLPGGIFQPYSGVATSILYIDKETPNTEIHFADFSNVSKDELDYKVEEFSNIIKKRDEFDSISRLVSYDLIALNEEFNLLPRKNILQTFSSKDYLQHGMPLKELIEKRVPSVSVSSANINDDGEGIPYLRISDLIDDQQLPYITNRPIKSVSDIDEMKSIKYIEDGYIAIAKVGNKLKPSIYKYSEPALAGINVVSFSINKNKVLPEYLVNELNSEYVKKQLDAIQIRGVGPNSYRERDLMEIHILVPPLNEQEIKLRGEASPLKERKSLKTFMDSFKNGLIDLFQEEETKPQLVKPIREEEIVSSIKHRISQYVSPVSSDLKNIELYIERKRHEGTPFSDNDKISGRENALNVTDVIKRMERNLQGIGQTFDLMKNILYFNREDSHFVRTDITSLISEAHDSMKDRLSHFLFSLTIEDNVQKQDLVVPVDKRQIIELLRNFFINSIKHGFDETIPKKIIYILISKDVNNNFIELNLINNGKPFPEGFTIDDFISFGRKGTDSNGTGIGGYLMKKIIDNHEGKLEWLGDKSLRFTIETKHSGDISSIATVHFKISLPYINN